MAKSKWSNLKRDMGESLVRVGRATGNRTRKRLWRVEDKEPQPVRRSTIAEWEARRAAGTAPNIDDTGVEDAAGDRQAQDE